MEAPKQLYVNPNERLFRGSVFFAFTDKKREDDVTYIQEDAVIEKACEWLENNLQGIVGGSIYMEDFRKYMKGE